jgi:hypothetical protein
LEGKTFSTKGNFLDEIEKRSSRKYVGETYGSDIILPKQGEAFRILNKPSKNDPGVAGRRQLSHEIG